MWANRIFGAAISIGIVVFSNLIDVVWLDKLQYVSIIHWTNIVIFTRKDNPISIMYIIAVEIMLMIGLILYIMKKSKKCTLDVLEII